MQKITRGSVTRYAFDYHDEPVLTVDLDEPFQVETDDALTGMIADDSDTPTVHRMVNDPHMDELLKGSPPFFNPVVGPIFVRGVAAGVDTHAGEVGSEGAFHLGAGIFGQSRAAAAGAA